MVGRWHRLLGAFRMFDVENVPASTPSTFQYTEGQPVSFDFHNGPNEGIRGEGRIRGKVSEMAFLSVWIVEVMRAENLSASIYPYTCIAVPSGCLKPL